MNLTVTLYRTHGCKLVEGWDQMTVGTKMGY